MTAITEQRVELAKLAMNVAAYLGSDWKGSYKELYSWKDIALVAKNDGAELHLFPGKDGRVEISGEYPAGYSSYAPHIKAITVALSRGPEVIAREIKGRFLMAYLETYAEAVKRIKQSEEFEAARLQAINELAAIVNTPIKNGVIYLSTPWLSKENKDVEDKFIRNIYGTVQVSSQFYGDLKIDSAPVSLLGKLLKVIADYAGQQEGDDRDVGL